MSRRGMVVGLAALALVGLGALRWWNGHLADEEARFRAERLARLPIKMEPAPAQAPAPVSGAGTPPLAVLPATKLVPVLAGRALREADDSPLDGAVVEVLGAPGPDGLPSVLCHTNTVPDGRFAITAPNLAATALRLWFPVDYKPAEDPPAGGPGRVLGDCIVKTVPLPSDAGSRLDLTVRLDTGWILSGTVTDTAGQPVTGGTVNVIEPRAFGLLDAQGHYRICDLPPAGPPLSVIASGQRVRSATLEAPRPQAGERVVQFDIQLAAAGMIYGRVTWRGGPPEPLTPPVITVLNQPAGALPGTFETPIAAVDGEHNFRIDGLGPGLWDLSCAWTIIENQQHRSCVIYARGIPVGPGAQVLHEFVLPGEATLEIQLTGAAGESLAGYRVEVGHVLDPEQPDSPVLREAWLTASAEGTCRLTRLAPGTKELSVMGQAAPLQPGSAPPRVERLATQRVTVVDGTNPVTLVVGAH